MQPSIKSARLRRLQACLCRYFTATAFIVASFPGLASAADDAHATNQLARNVSVAKAAGNQFRSFELLHEQGTPLAKRSQVSELISQGRLLAVDEEAAKSLLAIKPQYFTLSVPGSGDVELVRVNYDNLKIEGANGEDLSWTNTGVHYQGTLKGDAKSAAALSVFRNPETGAYEVTGVVGTPESGNTLIGRIKGSNPTNEHIVYRESAVYKKKAGPAVECGLDEVNKENLITPEQCPTPSTPTTPNPVQDKLTRILTGNKAGSTPAEVLLANGCVRIHLEVENDVYLAQGNNTANYATGFFNVAKTVYANENIPINLHYLKVWTTPNPEASINGYQAIWNNFWNRKYQEGIQGDLAMLVGFHIDRGIATLNRICGPDYNQTGISPIRDYPSYPTYSWASATFPHEIGHLFGSQHTQACAWNGNNTALDGCAAPEGSCARPSNQNGTIMSYCSNFSLAQGFGTQPGNLIRSSFAGATCLDCGGQGCTSSISPTTATVSANTTSGTIAVTTSASNCSWSASTGTSWLTITSGGGPFTGSGSVSYTVAANAGAARSATLTVAGQTFTVSQQAGTITTPLLNNVAVTASGAAGSEAAYYIDVPTGATSLVFTMSGGSGDVDLYTRFSTPPTVSAYDCRPYLSGNSESCTVPAPSAGRYHVMLRGYSAYSNASLKASFQVPNVTTVNLTAPAGGEVWSRGSTRTVSWTAANSQHVDIALYKGSNFVQWVAWHVVSSNSSYAWTIPSTLSTGNDYRITVLDYDQRNVSSSSGSFTLN